MRTARSPLLLACLPAACLPAACLLAGCAPTHPAPRGGIVSLNPCADQLLLALVPPGRIAAISHYSQDAAATSIPLDVARRFRATAGTAEEVIALRPDLVVASSFTPPATRAAFARARLRTLYLESPATIAASKAQIAQLAEAVDAHAAAAALLARIDTAAARAPPAGKPVPALLFLAGNLANGAGTLLSEEMNRAGFRNAAADFGIAMTARVPVEAIVLHPPAVMLTPDHASRAAILRRRLLRATGARTRDEDFPRALINCGGPTIPAALARLTAIRRRMAE